jgi:uracil-DNA glycosylase
VQVERDERKKARRLAEEEEARIRRLWVYPEWQEFSWAAIVCLGKVSWAVLERLCEPRKNFEQWDGI